MTPSPESAAFEQLIPGDPMPVFKPRTAEFERFSWDTLAGRYIVFCFLGTAGDAVGQAAVAALHAVSRVSSGRRYAFLPFVYDEVGAEIRARNMDRLSLTA